MKQAAVQLKEFIELSRDLDSGPDVFSSLLREVTFWERKLGERRRRGVELQGDELHAPYHCDFLLAG